MSLPEWNDEMKFELFRLKSELRPENFRVLAPPLGLGHIKTESSSASSKALFPSPMPAALSLQGPQPGGGAASKTAAVPNPTPTSVQQAPRRSDAAPTPGIQVPSVRARRQARHPGSWGAQVLKLGLIHLLDLAFVALCIALGFVALGLVIDPTNMSLERGIMGWALPVQVLQTIGGWAAFVGVYIVFALYWLFFKIVSGSTLGESCLHNFRQSPIQVPAAADNGSEERH